MESSLLVFFATVGGGPLQAHAASDKAADVEVFCDGELAESASLHAGGLSLSSIVFISCVTSFWRTRDFDSLKSVANNSGAGTDGDETTGAGHEIPEAAVASISSDSVAVFRRDSLLVSLLGDLACVSKKESTFSITSDDGEKLKHFFKVLSAPLRSRAFSIAIKSS